MYVHSDHILGYQPTGVPILFGTPVFVVNTKI